ncbi:glucose/arabinose dehydrogenase [Anseongella ginsenosidimutans]|uniref:Glucose/arabinose dehydrogenase n=1 Tax=Anseongella ginsenosidimutans TaxID=496056 RepID=A0A4R3KWQ0_9SPHI|nr:ThuA domain-containing protein [Anseongella ginsenosidimutans]TCS89838.1 glucose/arabinose dehydrogenase [Anseongella ginsenosidimutans]
MNRYSVVCIVIAAIAFAGCGQQKRDGEPRILVFSKTAGFRHSSIETGAKAIMKMGEEKGFTVDTTENSAVFNDDSLKKYSAIIFLNTTGDILDASQEASFERYIQAGGGFFGVHSATDTEYDWKWYGKLVGAYFLSHPQIQDARLVRHATPDFPELDSLPQEWKHSDEWYNFREVPSHVNVLVNIDEASYEGGSNGENHPMVWYHEYDGGRAFFMGMGHREESYALPAIQKLLYSGIQYAIGDNRELDYSRARTLLPPDEDRFSKVVLGRGLDEPTELTILPDNNILIAERKGGLKYYDAQSKTLKEIARLEVYHHTDVPNVNVEMGFMGIQADPDYENNHWVYAYYSPLEGPSVDRLSRFKFQDGKWDMESEQVILDVATTRDICCHTGGSIAFDAQGNLYLSTGDNSTPFDEPAVDGKKPPYNSHGFAPLDDRPGLEQYDGRRAPGNSNDLRGKVLRIKVQEDGSYTIPEGNLFEPGNEKARPEIYVMGNRNPYRISVDQKTGFLYWGEVGPDARGDSLATRGPRGYDEVNQARAAGNFGWPYFIADNQAYWQYDYSTGESQFQFNPEHPVNNSRNNTGLKELPPAQPAFIWYPYDESKHFPIVGSGGRTAMAGPVYYPESYPEATRLPEYYKGKLFIYEWIRNWIMVVTMDEQGDLMRIEPFMEGTKFFSINDMEIGPDGRIYFVEYGTGWFTQNENSSLSVIEYNGGNRPPVAELSIENTSGQTPLTVSLDAGESSDPDGDALQYTWIINEKEVTTTSEPEWTTELKEPGQYSLSVKISDGKGETAASQPYTVVAGNNRPEVSIRFEGNSQYYFKNKPVRYSVSVTDAEDGSLGEKSIDAGQVLVQKDYLTSPDKAATTLGHQQFANPALEAQAVMSNLDCAACHKTDEVSVGPSFMQVSQKYKGQDNAVDYLAGKIISGGSGVWGEVSMPAHPTLASKDAKTIATWIKSLSGEKTGPASLPAQGSFVPSNEFKLTDQGMVALFASYTDKSASGSLALTGNSTVYLRSPFLPAPDAATLEGLTKGEHEGKSFALVGGNTGSLAYEKVDLTGVAKVRIHYAVLGENKEGWTIRLEAGNAGTIAEGVIGRGETPMKPQSTVLTIKESGMIENLRVSIQNNQGEVVQLALSGFEWMPE